MSVCAWVKLSKILPILSSGIPIPVSVTEKKSLALPSDFDANFIRIMASPWSVNFMALFVRLINIWLILYGSPIRLLGTSLSISPVNFIPFSSAFILRVESKLSSTFCGLKLILSNVTFPDSILEKSKISLIITKRLSAEYFINLRLSVPIGERFCSLKRISVNPKIAFIGVRIS